VFEVVFEHFMAEDLLNFGKYNHIRFIYKFYKSIINSLKEVLGFIINSGFIAIQAVIN
jgi:hypothetical protein